MSKFNFIGVLFALLMGTSAFAAGPYYYYIYPSTATSVYKSLNGGGFPNQADIQVQSTSGTTTTYNNVYYFPGSTSNPTNLTPATNLFWQMIDANQLNKVEVIGVQCAAPPLQVSCGTGCTVNEYWVDDNGIYNCKLIYSLMTQGN